jgi:hypothetical protein
MQLAAEPQGDMYEIGQYNPTHPLRIWAGRPHPTDPSRFAIEYEINGKRGYYDGRVVDRTESDELTVDVHLDLRPGSAKR